MAALAGRPGRKPPWRIAPLPGQPDKLPHLSFSAIDAALKKRRKPSGLWERELRRAVKNSAKNIPPPDDERGD